MTNTTLLLHANILYAEIPFKNIPLVVKNSYIPVLKIILKNPEIKVVLNFSGFTLEVLNEEHQDIYEGNSEVISLLKEGLKNNQIELTGTSWAHAVLPIMPLPLIKKDIELFNSTCKRILDYKPKGFFPPELGIAPIMPPILKEFGYDYCFFDSEFIKYTEKGYLNNYNDFEPKTPLSFTKETAKAKYGSIQTQLRHLSIMDKQLKNNRDFKPVTWLGAENSSITGLSCHSAWITYSLVCLSRISIMNEKKLFKTITQYAKNYTGLFMPYSSDIEFYGYGGNTVKDPVPVSRLESLIDFLLYNENTKLILPSEYLKQNMDEHKSLYLKSGSWSSDNNFELWEKESDNEILNKVCEEAYFLFRKKYKMNKTFKKKDLNILKALLLSYNSDGRGWTPLPEHRLFCFNKALLVQSILED